MQLMPGTKSCKADYLPTAACVVVVASDRAKGTHVFIFLLLLPLSLSQVKRDNSSNICGNKMESGSHGNNGLAKKIIVCVSFFIYESDVMVGRHMRRRGSETFSSPRTLVSATDEEEELERKEKEHTNPL